MGNKVARCGLPVVSVHHDDGRVSHYMAPVSVADLLEDHPDYFVVTIKDGRKNILTPTLELQHGGNYYIIPPPRLFSSTEPPSNSCGCSCCAGCAHLPQVISTYFASTSFGNCPSFNSKLEFTVTEAKDGVEKVVDEDGIESQTLGALLGWFTTGAADRNMELEEDSPRRPSFSRYSYEKVKKEESPQRSSFESSKMNALTPKRARSKSESSPRSSIEKPRISFERPRISFERPRISVEKPRNSFERLRISLSLPKEKWLEDMIRGAENQWKRLHPDLAAKANKGNGDPNPPNCKGTWSCTWWVMPRRSSASKKDQLEVREILDQSLSIQDVEHPTPATKSEDSALDSDVKDAAGTLIQKKSLRELSMEIEKLEQLEQQERDLGNKQSLRLQIGEVERQIMRSSSVRNAFQL